ncbi:MAG: AAA family ATPase [Spirochaetaceae bacterium]|nr:AAA family ATPase [Spirochaetaceae bacterium]
MLTRLRVSGFRNLVDADVRFGPFTCVVGPNGAGKSNLFDAIRFLSALADGTLGEAVAAVYGQRGACGRYGGAAEMRGLFHRSGDRVADRMRFVADMVVPWRAVDDLGQVTAPAARCCATPSILAAANREMRPRVAPSPWSGRS